jgi:sensor histidine kinase YesM
MNSTIEPISYLIKRSDTDNFGEQLKNACKLFRFYSSVILVIVGKKIILYFSLY